MVLSMDRKTTHLMPTWQDIDMLQSIYEALSPLSDLTDILSGEDYVTVSVILPLMNLLNSKFLKEKEDTQLTADIKQRIRTDLNNRLSSYDCDQLLLLQCASYLDPQFKGKYLDEDEVEDVKIKVMNDLLDLTVNPEDSTQSDQPAQSTSTITPQLTITSTATNQPPSKKRKLGTLFKENDQESASGSTDTQPSMSREQLLQSEIESYTCMPRLDFEENPLKWWKVHSSNYPFLATFARRYLCVCATSSPSERLFSSSGHIASPIRMKLKPDMVNMLTFLSKNLD